MVVVAEPGRVSTAVDWGRGCRRGLMAGPVYLLKGSVSGGMWCKGESLRCEGMGVKGGAVVGKEEVVEK